ncbi:RNA polymerase II C-terminal domain kinase beta subunit [Coemansia biformis]|uniref:RNA polymerase II C-terminal domain kinase beta subunit n=1 Tax=Coemansia biformis TaxID=1286918 RepID=A0A9W7YF20_9FUNG|nr:RNA polymerase II C-terminal domain kinase beta subunit [Coemansia biformis]
MRDVAMAAAPAPTHAPGSSSRYTFMTRGSIASQLGGDRPGRSLEPPAGALAPTPPGRNGLLDHPTMMAAAKGCVFIKDVARSLGLPARTIGTAQLLAHRVYIFQPSPPASSTDVATACLLVAAKMEETIKRLRDILAHSYVLSTRSPDARLDPQSVPAATIDKMRPNVLAAEQFVMDTIGFDFRTSHPHLLYVKLAKMARVPQQTTAAFGWAILSDAFFTTLPIQYPPVVVAAGSLCLAWNLDRESPADTAPFILESLSASPAPPPLAPPHAPRPPIPADDGGGGRRGGPPRDRRPRRSSAAESRGGAAARQARRRPESLDLAAAEWWSAFGVPTEDIQGFVRQIIDFYSLFFSSAIAPPAYMEQHECGLPSKAIAQKVGQWRMRLDGVLWTPAATSERD